MFRYADRVLSHYRVAVGFSVVGVHSKQDV